MQINHIIFETHQLFYVWKKCRSVEKFPVLLMKFHNLRKREKRQKTNAGVQKPKYCVLLNVKIIQKSNEYR